jgi:hypothetical protein
MNQRRVKKVVLNKIKKADAGAAIHGASEMNNSLQAEWTALKSKYQRMLVVENCSTSRECPKSPRRKKETQSAVPTLMTVREDIDQCLTTSPKLILAKRVIVKHRVTPEQI